MQQSPCIYSVLKLGTVNHPSNCRGAERGFVRACSGCQPRSRAHRQRPSWPLTPPASRWIDLNPRGAILFAPRLLKQWQTWAVIYSPGWETWLKSPLGGSSTALLSREETKREMQAVSWPCWAARPPANLSALPQPPAAAAYRSPSKAKLGLLNYCMQMNNWKKNGLEWAVLTARLTYTHTHKKIILIVTFQLWLTAIRTKTKSHSSQGQQRTCWFYKTIFTIPWEK